MAESVAGRDSEQASLRAFVASVESGAAALVLEGEAGIGKTTLWAAGLAEAADRDIRVLEARPAENETALSFSSVGDLLRPVLDEALASLPTPQRRALMRSLVLDDEGPPPDPHTIGVALLSAFRALASETPLVVAVDDVQWLDPASASVLGYSLRRLRSERLGILLALRTPSESALVSDLRRSFPTGRMTTVEVTALDVVALHRVVQQHLGAALPRPLLAEVHEASGGNPFYALEIVRTLQRTSAQPGRPLPMSESLSRLVHERLLALPPPSRDFLLAAAAHAQPTIAVTEAACGVARHEGLTPAVGAGIVRLDGERIRFTHPLLAAGAYEAADPDRRGLVHARLAELLDDPEARAWQLAAAALEPAEEVARALEEAAEHARMRGALRSAALLLERAQELTPPQTPEDSARRGVDASFLHFEAGDSARAETGLRRLIGGLAAGPSRARALAVLARIRLYDQPKEARELFMQVIAEAGDDRHTLAVAHEGIASTAVWLFEGWSEVIEHTGIALGLSQELGDEALAADVLLSRNSAQTLLGRAEAAATAEQALSLQESASDLRILDQPLISLAESWTWTDQHARAHAALVQLFCSAHDMGDENARPWLHFLLGVVERELGNLDLALSHARDGQEAAEQSRQPLFLAVNAALESQVDAELGRVDASRDAARRAVGTGPDGFASHLAATALGHLELMLRSPERAAERLAGRVAFVRDEGIVEPGATRFVVDQVQALVELGRVDEAAELLDWYEGNARRLERASAIAASLRCRGFLASHAGDLDAALAAFAEALEWHARVSLPLDRARTLLALGAARRRANQRLAARRTLEEAVAAFERIGAALWAECARGELARISGRAPTPDALTPAEGRVAALVAEGRTNPEIADALFLSRRTVEGHLSRIFRKLGIRHRGEVARALAARQTEESSTSNTGEMPVSAPPLAP